MDPLVRQVIGWIEQIRISPGSLVALFGITLLALALFRGLFMFLMRQTIIVMSRHIEFDQKNEIYQHYQLLDTRFYKSHSTGDLMNRMAEDVSRVRMFTGPAIMYLINLIALISLSIFYMLKKNAELTAYVLAPLPLLAVTIYFVNTIINRKSEKIQALLSDLTTNAQESYSGIRVIKSFVQEGAMIGFFNRNSAAYRDNAISLARVEAIYFPSMAFMIGLSTLLTIMIGGLYYINHKPGVDMGLIVEFIIYINMLTFPVSAIGWVASMIQRAIASQKRLNEFLDTASNITDDKNARAVELEGKLAFNNVSFTYPQTGITALKDFNMTVEKGQKVAIIGRTGSGKSTIAQLLLRMYDPQQGSVQIDGLDLRQIQLTSLRTQLGYVPQEAFLFSDTVRNNIRFGLEEAGHEEVEQAAWQASVHEDISQFPQGYDTMIGERGVTLSGGQKQRISIARALIKNPEIVILDDCLSAVDAHTEKEIIGRLYDFLQNRTAIIITHRIFAHFEFDKIMVLEDGRIAEEGTHAELLARNGIYTGLYTRQQAQETDN